MSSEISIKVENLSKCFQIYDQPRDRLKQFVMPRLQRILGQTSRQYFREFWALNDVSFEINKGETVGIIGRNGSGKSTLLQLICGTLSPTVGSVKTNGRIAAMLELGSGFNPEFTGRENVFMSAAVLGLNTDEINEKFDAIAAFADIGQFIEQPVKSYSSGMYVRLAFAVNILSDPEIMIVDEALAVGDMAFQAKCMTALNRIQARGTTVLFVSHDIGALRSLCTRGIYLDKGALQGIGPASQIAERYVQRMREEINSEPIPPTEIISSTEEANLDQAIQLVPVQKNIENRTAFELRVAQFRYGVGGVRITFAELLDEEMCPINGVGFNQSVVISVHCQSSINGNVGCNYYIKDDKKNLILGASLDLLNQELIQVESGQEFVVKYKTKLPLGEGAHSIELQIVKLSDLENQAVFLDVVDDAIVFQVYRREGARIWTKAFVENSIEVTKC
jgi:lipopolysaccharide transport system ATP-binding protein